MEHDHFSKAKPIVENWFKSDENYNKAATAWNNMNIGIIVSLIVEENK